MYYILGNFFIVTAIILAFIFIVRSFNSNFSYKENFYFKLALCSANLLAFLTLIFAYVNSDFSLVNVYQNSDINKPLFYKIAGVWGNHEGSLLLFILLHSLIFLCSLNTISRISLVSLSSFFSVLINLIFLLFLFFFSNPFSLHEAKITNGLGLNPVLQDIALIIHPPILYLGYVILAVIYAYILALKLRAKAKADWSYLSGLIKSSFFFLTFGIILGSWWAYRELGWGGYWFWDPVENLALIIWLFNLMLLHIYLANQYEYKFNNWIFSIGSSAFVAILASFFMVRSGVLVSVHSFATDPMRGICLLFILLFFIVLTIYISFFTKNNKHSYYFRFNHIGLLFINNFLVIASLIIVVFGTLYPIFFNNLFSENLYIGERFFNQSLTPILLIILYFLSLVLFRSNKFNAILITLTVIFFTLSLIFIFAVELIKSLLIILCLFIIIATIYSIIAIIIKGRSYGKINMLVAHLGFVIFVLGLLLNNLFKYELERNIKLSDSFNVKNITMKFIDMQELKEHNYYAVRANFNLLINNKSYIMSPEKRIYFPGSNVTSEVVIKRRFLDDIYLVIGQVINDETIKIRFIYNPFINLLWLGAFILLLQFIFIKFLPRDKL
jgi:cytochrome c-type biogenesis protein CcmF